MQVGSSRAAIVSGVGNRMNERSPLAFPVFRAVWIATLGASLGTFFLAVGASWLMVASGASPQMIALVQASASLPVVLVSLAAGAIADNMDRRKVMLTAQIFILTVSGSLAGLTYFGVMTPRLLLAFTFLVGCGTALNGPAWQASVGDMVPRAVLPNAVAYNSLGLNLARTAGPAIGGAIVAVGGAASAFLVNALSSLGLVFVLLRWRPKRSPRALPPERLGDAMRAGLRYVAMSPHTSVLLLRAGLFGCATSAIQALLPLVARDLLNGGPLTFGVLLGSFGIGAVAGALGIRRVNRALSAEAMIRAATIVTVLGTMGAALSHTAWLTCPCLALAGVGWVFAFSTFNVAVQLASPNWVLGRALALYQMTAFAGIAAGSWAIGFCADHLGTRNSLYAAAGFDIVALAVSLVLPLTAFSNQNLDPSERPQMPQPAVPVEDGSGPIVITIEYRVLQINAMRFLAAMSERRRIRLRDGARQWTLLRDLGDPELWVEDYKIPTWLDYIRHNSRCTQADHQNSQALRALWNAEPILHRRIESRTLRRSDKCSNS